MTILRSVIATLLVLVPIAIVALAVATINWQPPSGKYEPVEQLTTPSPQPQRLVRKVQLEDHTCGYRALQALYEGYGIDPAEARLRFRLGVDRTAAPLAAGTEGTLHPDMLRVLDQDGFAVQIVDLEGNQSEGQVIAHLKSGHPAVALIVRPTTGGLHWILLSALSDGQVIVVDSLEPSPLQFQLRPYLEETIVSLILVSPQEGTPSETTKLHALGLGEMRAVRKRLESR